MARPRAEVVAWARQQGISTSANILCQEIDGLQADLAAAQADAAAMLDELRALRIVEDAARQVVMQRYEGGGLPELVGALGALFRVRETGGKEPT